MVGLRSPGHAGTDAGILAPWHTCICGCQHAQQRLAGDSAAFMNKTLEAARHSSCHSAASACCHAVGYACRPTSFS